MAVCQAAHWPTLIGCQGDDLMDDVLIGEAHQGLGSCCKTLQTCVRQKHTGDSKVLQGRLHCGMSAFQLA